MALPRARTAAVSRVTNETTVHILLNLDGGVLPQGKGDIDALTYGESATHHATQTSKSQTIIVDSSIGFLDHMIHAFAKHAGRSLRLHCRGDLHNTSTIITPPRIGLRRFGHAYEPLDDALSRAVIDLSNQPYSVIDLGLTREKIGDLSTEMLPHVLRSWAQEAGVTLHVDCLRGANDHHRAESAFKALAIAVREATTKMVGKEDEIPSTKGVL